MSADDGDAGWERLRLWSLTACFAMAAAAQIFAGVGRFGLYADGAYCLREVLSSRWFGCLEAPRRTIQMGLEAPTILALRLGVTDLQALAVIFSLTLQLAPLVLTVLCIAALWPRQRVLAVLPALHYFAGSAAIASNGLLEGPTAAAYAWLLLALILFRSSTPKQRVALWIISLPAAFGHEVMLLLAPGLAAAAMLRAMARGGDRWTMATLGFWFLAVAGLQLHFTLAPRDTANRQGYIDQLLGFKWLWAAGSGLNTPGVLGLLALAAVALIAISPRTGRVVAPVFVAIAAASSAWALDDAAGRSPILQFFARNQPAIVAIPLAFAMMMLRHRTGPQLALSSLPILGVLLALAASTSVIQAATTRDWTAYLAQLQDVLRARSGLVAQEVALAELRPADRARFGRMAWGWTYPDLSVLLSAEGKVDSLIINPGNPRWQPWDPTRRETYPESRLWCFGRLPTVND